MNKVWIKVGLGIAAAVMLGMMVMFLIEDQQEQPVVSEEENQAADWYVTYEGQKYEYDSDIRNILFIGVDQTGPFEKREAGNGGQADSLVLLSMNKSTEQISLLEISRESMVPVKVYDSNGFPLETKRGQVALQYAYGDGKEKSCRLMKTAVSELLYEIPVHAYIAMGLDGIVKVTDLLGGVKITVPEDYTNINSQFVKGAEIVLNGEMAEQYVRYRDTQVSGSNTERMERQTQFIEALAAQLQGKEMSWYEWLFRETEEYVLTDLTYEEMERLSAYEMVKPIQSVPGEVILGEEHDEFVVDNDQLQKMIINLFYKSVK